MKKFYVLEALHPMLGLLYLDSVDKNSITIDSFDDALVTKQDGKAKIMYLYKKNNGLPDRKWVKIYDHTLFNICVMHKILEMRGSERCQDYWAVRDVIFDELSKMEIEGDFTTVKELAHEAAIRLIDKVKKDENGNIYF